MTNERKLEDSAAVATEYALNEAFDGTQAIGAPFDALERRTRDYVGKVRGRARQVVESAREEVGAIVETARDELARERERLKDRAAALDAERARLDSAREELETLRRALENDARESARREGYDKGVAQGRAEGEKLAREEANAALEAAVAAETDRRLAAAQDAAMAPIYKLTRELKGARQALLKNWEENIMQIAAAIAYQTIMREPEALRNAPVELLREALELAMNCATLKIRMNPRDLERLREPIEALLEETGNLAKSEVVPDQKISLGGCVVETSLGVVDERLEARLERIISELSE